MNTPTPVDSQARRAARRTAWVLGAVAVGCYIAFLLAAVVKS